MRYHLVTRCIPMQQNLFFLVVAHEISRFIHLIIIVKLQHNRKTIDVFAVPRQQCRVVTEECGEGYVYRYVDAVFRVHRAKVVQYDSGCREHQERNS